MTENEMVDGITDSMDMGLGGLRVLLSVTAFQSSFVFPFLKVCEEHLSGIL